MRLHLLQLKSLVAYCTFTTTPQTAAWTLAYTFISIPHFRPDTQSEPMPSFSASASRLNHFSSRGFLSCASRYTRNVFLRIRTSIGCPGVKRSCSADKLQSNHHQLGSGEPRIPSRFSDYHWAIIARLDAFDRKSNRSQQGFCFILLQLQAQPAVSVQCNVWSTATFAVAVKWWQIKLSQTQTLRFVVLVLPTFLRAIGAWRWWCLCLSSTVTQLKMTY